MKFALRMALVGSTCLALSACNLPFVGELPFFHSKPKPPTGQVVAVVGGQEVTQRELNAELGNLTITDPKARKAAQDQALQSILARKVLAKEARAEGIDKTADFALARQRFEEAQLAQALEAKVAASVPAPTSDEVSRYISDNPDLFREHKVFVVDQLQIPRQTDPAIIKQLQPIKSIDAIASFLTEAKVPFQHGAGQLDSLGLGPNVTAAILKVGSEDVFILPNQNALVLNKIREVRTDPLTGDAATKVATQFLTRQHTQDSVRRAMEGYLKTAAPTMAFNAAFKPMAPAAPANPNGAKPAAALK